MPVFFYFYTAWSPVFFALLALLTLLAGWNGLASISPQRAFPLGLSFILITALDIFWFTCKHQDMVAPGRWKKLVALNCASCLFYLLALFVVANGMLILCFIFPIFFLQYFCLDRLLDDTLKEHPVLKTVLLLPYFIVDILTA